MYHCGASKCQIFLRACVVKIELEKVFIFDRCLNRDFKMKMSTLWQCKKNMRKLDNTTTTQRLLTKEAQLNMPKEKVFSK